MVRSRRSRLVATVVGVSLLVGVLSACLPSEDEGWNVQQLVLEAQHQPRGEGPVTAALDGGSIAFTGPTPSGPPPLRVPELLVVDQGQRELTVRELAVPDEYPDDDYRTWDGVLSADGLVMVGVGVSSRTASRVIGQAGEAETESDPSSGERGGAGDESSSSDGGGPDSSLEQSDPGDDDCGNDHYYYNSQILRWTRSGRSSDFGEPELVSMDVADTADCIESEVELMVGWMGVRGWQDSSSPSVSGDGSTVVFVSQAVNLGADVDTPTLMFRDGDDSVDRVTSSGWTDAVLEAQVSADGLHIAFIAQADEADPQVYVVSRTAVGQPWGTPLLLSTVGGNPSETGDGPDDVNRDVSISGDGGRVAWISGITSFESGITKYSELASVLVVWDRTLNTKQIAVSRGDGTESYPMRGGAPKLSHDGKRIGIMTVVISGTKAEALLFNVDKLMSTNSLIRRRSVAAFRPLESQPYGDLAISGSSGVYGLAFSAQDAPIDRYTGSPPSLYVVGGRGFGAGISRGWHGDPVDVSIGAFAHSEADVVGRGGLVLERSYNSFSNEAGMFGQGWITLYDTTLTIDDVHQAVRVRTPEGRSLTYWETNVPGEFTTGAGSGAVLSGHPGGYRWVERSGRTFLFGLDGSLTGVERPGFPDITVTHTVGEDEQEWLVELDETTETWLRLVDDQMWLSSPEGFVSEPGFDERVDRLESSDGIQVVYENYKWGLNWVSRPHVDGETAAFGRRFEWSDGGRIERIIDEIATGREHTIVDNTYDQMGRVVEQVNDTGDVLEFHHGVRWVDDAWVAALDHTTVVNQASGDRVAYKYGPGGEVLAVTDPFGASNASQWEGDQRKSSTSRSGVKVQTTFDAAKRPITMTETVGNSNRTLASFTYLVADTDPSAGSDQRLASTTDAAGVTTWFTYNETASNSAQLPHTVAVPCDAQSLGPDLSCPGSGRAETTYVYGTGDLEGLVMSVTDPDGVVTEFGYAADRSLATVTTFPDSETELETTRSIVRRGDTGFAETNPAAAWVEILTDAADAETQTVYGADGRVLEIRDPLFDGSTHLATLFDYWGNGDLKSVTDPAGNTTTYDTLRPGDTGFTELDDLGTDPAEITVATDPDGVSTITVTDRSGDTVASAVGDITEPGDLAVTTFEYGPLGRLTSTTDPEGVVTRYGYDIEGRVTQTTTGAALGAPDRTTTTVYDAQGRVVQVTGPLSDDPDENPVQSHQVFTYDTAGRLVARIDGNPAVSTERLMTSFHYDTTGRQWRTVEHRAGNLNPAATTPGAGDAVTETRFTLAGRTAAVATAPVDDPSFNWSTAADIDKAWTSYSYDDAGRQTTVTSPDDTTWTTEYDAVGRAISRTSPEGRETGYGYNDAGQLIAVSAPSPTGTGLATSITTYTPTGLVATQTDPHVPQIGVTDPSTRFFGYTDGGRLETVTDALGNTVTYTYDTRGNRQTRTSLDDNDNPIIESWEYDLADRLIGHTRPAPTTAGTPQTTTYDYHPDTGWLTTTTDPTGRVTTLDHYGDGSTRTATHTGPSLATITTNSWRNSRGRQTQAVTTDGTNTDTTQNTFDRAGQPTSTLTPAGETLQWTWDLVGNPLTRNDPGGITSWTHNPNGQIASIGQDPGTGPNTIATYTYDDDGLLLNETLVTGGSRTWTYNTAGKADSYTQVTTRPDTSTDTWTVDLDWRHDGRLHAQTINNDPTVTYSYDNAGQLVAADDGDTIDLTWTYGTRGNRLTSSDGATTTTWDTNPNGSIAQTTTGTTTTTYTYDLAGRRTAAATGTETLTTSYDAAGRLAVVDDGDTVWARRYDASGNIAVHVVTTTLGTESTLQVTDTVTGPYSRTIGQSTDSGTTWALDLYGPAGPIGETGTPAAYQTDHLGSVIEEPTNPAVVSGPADYDPHGQPETPIADHRLGYRAEQTTAGLIHLRHRDYDPTTGQFLATDPLDGVPGTPTVANPYHYADNDPLNKVDPLGLRARDGSLISFDALGYATGVRECAGEEGRTENFKYNDSMLLETSPHKAEMLERYGVEYVGVNLGLGPLGRGYLPVVRFEGSGGPCLSYVPMPTESISNRMLLELLGFVPGLGDIVDAGLCGWDSGAAIVEKGSKGDAAISCLAIIPVVGSFGRIAKKATPRTAGGVANAASGARLNARLAADEIASGHAYTKHVVQRGEFPGIRTRTQFADMVENVINHGDVRHLSGGRTAYWRDGVVVIRNPRAPDGGTAFVPRDGYDYFLGLG